MTNPSESPKPGEHNAPPADEGNEFAAVTSQEDLDKIISKRLARERDKLTSQFADYDAVKAKAEQFDAAQDAAKTELERAQERTQELETKLAQTETEKLRSELAGAAGVPVDLVAGSDEESMKASIVKVIEFRDAASSPRSPKPDLRQGAPGGGAATTADLFAGAIQSRLK